LLAALLQLYGARKRTGCLGLVFKLLEQVRQHGADLAVGQGRGFVERGHRIFEFLELLELQGVDDGSDVLGGVAAEELLVLALEEGITRAAVFG
jgi:hypothetical protein